MEVKRDVLGAQLKDTKRVCFYGFVVVVLAIAAHMISGSYAAHGALLGGVCGLAGHWRATCWAQIEIPRTSMSNQGVLQWLHGIGYLDVPGTNELKPNFPEWLCFDAQTVTLQQAFDVTRVRGPYYVLKKLARAVSGSEVAA